MGTVARTSGTATMGLVLAVAGIAALAFAMMADGAGWIVFAIGATLLVGGLVLVATGLRKPEPVLTIPPAHITFYQQNKRDLPMPPLQSAEVRIEADFEPITAEDLEVSRLDVQIREVARKINKATVMLGTGKLSDEGYRRYVQDLKAEKADLEAAKVRIEMARGEA